MLRAKRETRSSIHSVIRYYGPELVGGCVVEGIGPRQKCVEVGVIYRNEAVAPCTFGKALKPELHLGT